MKKILAIVLCLAVVCFSAGCGTEEQQAAVPLLAAYDGGVINTGGQMILARSANRQQFYIFDNDVLYDRWGEPRYAMQTENHFVGEPPARLEPNPDSQVHMFEDGEVIYLDYGWDESITGRTFRFYDSYGELLQTVDIAAEASNPYYVRFLFAPDGDLQNSVFVVDQLAEHGSYQLLDYTGGLLAEKAGVLGSDARVTLAPGFAAVQYATADGDYLDLYTPDGQPMPTEHKYFDLEQLSFGNLPPEERPLFYKARYINAEGRRRYDILDGQGQVAAGNLLGLESGYGGVYYATQGWGNLTSCWLDLRSGRPVWLAEDSAKLQDIDYYKIWRAEEEQLIAAMQTERDYDWINRVYYEDLRFGYYPSPYFNGERLLTEGIAVDVLDEKGKVLISGLKPWGMQYLGNDLFIVEQGFNRGLMNVKGEWLYKESIFTELAD